MRSWLWRWRAVRLKYEVAHLRRHRHKESVNVVVRVSDGCVNVITCRGTTIRTTVVLRIRRSGVAGSRLSSIEPTRAWWWWWWWWWLLRPVRLLRPLVLLLLLLLTVVRPLLLLPADARSSSRNVRVVRVTNVRAHRARARARGGQHR